MRSAILFVGISIATVIGLAQVLAAGIDPKPYPYIPGAPAGPLPPSIADCRTDTECYLAADALCNEGIPAWCEVIAQHNNGGCEL